MGERRLLGLRLWLTLLIGLRRLRRWPQELWLLRGLPRFKVGDIYLDCSGHPVVATEVGRYGGLFGPYDWDLAGVSLVDGSGPRSCSARHCRPKRLDYDEALNYLALREARERAARQISAVYEASDELRRAWG